MELAGFIVDGNSPGRKNTGDSDFSNGSSSNITGSDMNNRQRRRSLPAVFGEEQRRRVPSLFPDDSSIGSSEYTESSLQTAGTPGNVLSPIPSHSFNKLRPLGGPNKKIQGSMSFTFGDRNAPNPSGALFDIATIPEMPEGRDTPTNDKKFNLDLDKTLFSGAIVCFMRVELSFFIAFSSRCFIFSH